MSRSTKPQRPLKVLVVDDDEIVLELVREWLAEDGHEVHARAEALGTVAWILRHQPDVVLLDLRMPALSGEDLARLLQRDQHTRQTAIILHSSLSAPELESILTGTSAVGAIRKTADRDAFLADFHRLVDGPTSVRWRRT